MHRSWTMHRSLRENEEERELCRGSGMWWVCRETGSAISETWIVVTSTWGRGGPGAPICLAGCVSPDKSLFLSCPCSLLPTCPSLWHTQLQHHCPPSSCLKTQSNIPASGPVSWLFQEQYSHILSERSYLTSRIVPTLLPELCGFIFPLSTSLHHTSSLKIQYSSTLQIIFKNQKFMQPRNRQCTK